MTDKHENEEPDQKETQLSEDELGDVFGGRMLRIGSFYLRNRVKREATLDKNGQA